MKLEHQIGKHVQHVLDLPDSKISPQDNLIEYGLHSLAIMRLVDIFEKEYEAKLSYIDFAMAPSIEDWVKIIDDTKESKTKKLIDFPTPYVNLSEMQYAHWVGRQGENVSSHLYIEFAGKYLNIEKLQQAYTQLLQCHPMLSVSIAQGQQSIQKLTETGIRINDLTKVDEIKVSEFLAQQRQNMTHQKLDIESGQVIDVRVTVLPNQHHVLHIDTDMSAIDPQSCFILIQHLSDLYSENEKDLLFMSNKSSVPYFEYIQAKDTQREQQKKYDEKWWKSRLENISDIPALPYIAEGLRDQPNLFTREAFSFNASDTQVLVNIASEYNISVELICLTLFAETVALWSSENQFRLNLPFFSREKYGTCTDQEISHMVGDFSNMCLLDIHAKAGEKFSESLSRIKQSLEEVYLHSTYTGVEVLRDLSKYHQQLETAPIVFTSGLNYGEIISNQVQKHFGQPIWCISQGSKVDLDVQVALINEKLVINWDIRKNAFQQKVIPEMFKYYISRIQSFILDKEKIHSIPEYILPTPHTLLNEDELNLPFKGEHYSVIHGLDTCCPCWVIGYLGIQVSEENLYKFDPSDLINIHGQYWYKTTHQAYFNDQKDICVVSELNPQIKRNGYWLNPNDIAEKIAVHPAIQKVKLFPITKGEKNTLVALLVCALEESLSYTNLLSIYTACLNTQALQPEQSYIVSEDEIDQVNTENIEALLAKKIPIESQKDISALEKVIYFMMCSVIGISTEQEDDINIDFFEYGGDSLLATHLIAVIQKYFKDSGLTIVDIFSQRTVCNIAHIIEENLPNTAHKIASVFLQVMEGKNE